MSVDYRLLRADEVDAACDLWMEVYPDSLGHEAWRREFLSIPQHLEHTRVAVDPDGTLLSTVHYWLRHIRDVDGTPLQVGGISHVVTRANARRQGHAARLMDLTLAAIHEDGCAWSLLFTTEEGRPLYEHC